MGFFGKLFAKKNKQRSQSQTEAPTAPLTQEQPPEDAHGTATAEAVKTNAPAPAIPETPAKEIKESSKAPAKEVKETGKAPTKEVKEPCKAPAKEAKETGKAPAKAKGPKAADTKAPDTKEGKKAPAKTSSAQKTEKPGKPEEPEEVTEKAPAAGVGRFEIKKSKDGRYVFNLYASNHVIVATSQVYSSAQNARIGINSVIANAAVAGVEDQTRRDTAPLPYPKWELYQDNGGKYRFRLLATNASCVCHSQGYTSKANCKKGIESIIRTAKSATIDKAYLKKE